MKATLSGNLATMVPGVPYAIAAKFAFPDRVAVAMVGDGAMQMGGMAEMLTAAKYYKTWADPRTGGPGAQQRGPQPGHLGAAGHGRRPALRCLAAIPYSVVSRRMRGPHRSHRHQGRSPPSQIDDALQQAFAADRPVVIDAMTDPDEPPLPPHVTFEQAEGVHEVGSWPIRPTGSREP